MYDSGVKVKNLEKELRDLKKSTKEVKAYVPR